MVQEHMKSCVAEEVRAGNEEIIDETLALIKKLKG